MVRVIPWYEEHHRDFPFRSDPAPYHVWLSEIMLQQTRMETVIPYYERFLNEVPDVMSLALLPEDRLLKLWEGLGYYSRARNLKKAAVIIAEEYGGEIPSSFEALKTLPGIGSYTAAAIASIAFHEAVPVVDGNVLRVWARFTGSYDDVLSDDTKKRVFTELTALLKKKKPDPALFNQGLMELGETLCLPKKAPGCESCPLSSDCRARLLDLTETLPVRNVKTAKKTVEKTVLILKKDGKTAVVKREERDVLKGMYGFYDTEGKLSREEVKACVEDLGFTVNALKILPQKKHVFTHRIWEMSAWIIEVSDKGNVDRDQTIGNGKAVGSEKPDVSIARPALIFVSPSELKTVYALPSAFRKWYDEVFE